PAGHPAIPPGVPQNNVVVIITIHDAGAPNANRSIPHNKLSTTRSGVLRTRQAVNGVHIFLRRIGPDGGQHCFNFGRERTPNTKPNKVRDNLDVYLPGPASAIGIRQCALVPVWECNSWRLQSASEKIATVNGVPIQVHTARTTDHRNSLPQAVYLKQSEVNHVVINGIRIDIWLMKSVRQIYGEQDFTPSELNPRIQDLAHRLEPWAQQRWNLTEERVSAKTFRVIHRFTGEKDTAKVYQSTPHHQQLRDQEFAMFNKQEVDASVIRYLHSTEFTNIPAIITDSHEGFMTYASLRDELRRSHPGIRFEIATKMIRRLFHAVGFLHFNNILHRGVNNGSVLMKMVDGKVERVLLVDYSTARPFPSGEPLPVEKILDDSQAVMEIVEDCCDIWAFRNGPKTEAQGESLMQRRTTEKHEQYMMVKRVAADFFGRRGKSQNSEKGKKLLRLLSQAGNDWHSARSAQAENLRLREIATLSKSKINAKIQEWDGANPVITGIGQKPYMLLSLGHPYLDSLSNQLYTKRWDSTAHEVCTKFKDFGGDLEEPWQTFEVKKATHIPPVGAGYTGDSVMTWLASCCEIHPEWRTAVEMEVDHHVPPQAKVIDRTNIGNLYAALQDYGCLPATMVAMLDRLMSTDVLPNPVEETYHVWYHIPSRHFNLTHLHRLADPDRLQAVITEDKIHCDNFVEVRGDSKIEGCFASLSLLVSFCDVLGLELPQAPDLTVIPTFDPSDFSEVQPGRIILARPGMLGYASMIRSAEQMNWLNPKAPKLFETSNSFLPTNFGDMKVIPTLPYGRSHERPEHWSKYKTAEETEASLDVGKRKALSARAKGKGDPDIPVKESVIAKLLRDREMVRVGAQFPAKRIAVASSSPAASPTLPTAQLPFFSDSFMQRMEDQAQGRVKTPQPGPSGQQSALNNSNMAFMGDAFRDRNSALLTAPPNDPTNFNQSFTVADDTETLENDWKAVDALFKKLPDDEDECVNLTGFNL
ncbi:hypothetical protein CC86DRAFT_265506, partial [Ophiobolus disseminans]